jgi:FHS family L-fucose permease-like MFS transporter
MIFQADGKHGSAAFPYTVIGIVVLSVAFVFANIRLPEIKSVTQSVSVNTGIKALWENKLFRFGVIAQFFYVGAQTGINSFFINYVTEINPQITSREAALLLSFGGMGLFMAGRFLGSWMMRFVDPSKLLGIVSMGATICMILVIAAIPWISVSALFICYLFESIMFPTIFALSISGLGENTKQGSSFLIMSIVGGAIAPVLMGLIGAGSMAVGFVVPLICFLIVLGFSIFLQHKNKVLIVNHL